MNAKTTGANVKLANGEEIPFNKKFDKILCTETIEHIPNYKKAINKMKNKLNKNGKIIITIPLEKSYFWRLFSIIYPPEKYRGHINLLNSNELIDLFKPLKVKKKIFIQTPFLTLNKILPQFEKFSMYIFVIFEN